MLRDNDARYKRSISSESSEEETKKEMQDLQEKAQELHEFAEERASGEEVRDFLRFYRGVSSKITFLFNRVDFLRISKKNF